MSYCLNPTCPYPINPAACDQCQSCGSKLLLRDRYRVMKPLGKGGFGATFLAHDESLPGEPICAIKQLRPEVCTPRVLQMARELFAREAKTLGKIGNHPQVPRLLDYFEDSKQFYLVQEYINGSTLQQEVKRSGPYSEARVKQFLSEILPLLQYIHEQQVIHRDIKPNNLIRRSFDGKLVLIDFGAVKDQLSQTMTSLSEPTAFTSYAVGTPGFAPPEQLAMRPVYASDIYAVGVTCIYLLTGKSPKDLDYNPLTGEMLWQHKCQVSDHLAKVLSKMLEVSVEHRYQSANEVERALALEPYLKSLTKGMAVQASGSQKRSLNQTKPNFSACLRHPDAGYSFSPRVAQMAAAIRARRVGSAKANSVQIPSKLDTNCLLTAYVKGRRDFALHDLRKLDLQKADLRNVNFHGSKLDKTNFQGANLFNSDFGRAGLNRANFRKANLSRAYLSQADLEGADLRGADLSYAYLNNANLRGANLCGANLTGAKLADEQLAQALTNWMTVLPSGKRVLL